jgi:hypothetical protein
LKKNHEYQVDFYEHSVNTTRKGEGLFLSGHSNATFEQMFSYFIDPSVNKHSWCRTVQFDIFEFFLCVYQLKNDDLSKIETFDYVYIDRIIKHGRDLQKKTIKFEEEIILRRNNQMFGVNEIEVNVNTKTKQVKISFILSNSKIDISNVNFDELV